MGHSGGRGDEHGRGHDGGIKLNRSAPLIPLPKELLAFKICCEICRVECSSLKMLAEHKNGKKHRKTFQRYKEMLNQVVAQANAITDTEELEQEGKVAGTAGTAQLPNRVEQKGKFATTDGIVELSKVENYRELDAKQGGMKRKMSDSASQGGKRLKKSKQEPQRICTICEAVCETLVSFDAHIAGKKHRSKLQKFQPLDAVFGPIAAYTPPNQPNFIPAYRPDPLYFGLGAYQIVGQVMHGVDGAHLGSLQNQDAPLLLEQKEKTELENNVNNVAN